MDPRMFWMGATQTERDHLQQVYHRVQQIPTDLEGFVKSALLLEILEQYDHRAWPGEYQLAGIEWDLQGTIMNQSESMSCDARQRASYMRLLMASNDRHNDVAYGLSQPLLWSDRDNVVQQLLAMGRRQYIAPIPTSHEMDNGVLHVAVSYKHTSNYSTNGTISEQQANAIWTAVHSILFVHERTTVRVWVDQNLHRRSFPAGTEWHEFGLLPYACLKTVFVGDGDFSLRLARTRPWLWVELITAMKSDGIHGKPGCDLVQESDGVLVQMENYEKWKNAIMRYGWVMGASINVDDVMRVVTQMISFWRRDGFLEHGSYEYADDFEKFVNWARRFVIRNVPYSEMKWNHSSETVSGMDAVVLLRAMPNSMQEGESILGLARPEISWEVEEERDAWVLGDLFDRSLVGELPLSALIESTKVQVDDGEDVQLYGKHSAMERVLFHKSKGTISLVLGRNFGRLEVNQTKYAAGLSTLFEMIKHRATTVTLRACMSDGPFLSYKPFTHRMLLEPAGFAVGDASLRPTAVQRSITEDMRLRKRGVCYNAGICEQVYTMEMGDRSFPLSANEVDVLLSACNSDVARSRAMAKSLKDFSSYKSMRYRDMSDGGVLLCTRGRKVEKTGSLANTMFVSGEIDTDIDEELVDIIRRRNDKHTLVWVDRVDGERVQVVFRGSHHITHMIIPWIGANKELAILEETDRDRLVNEDSIGLVQMAVGMQPKVKVKQYGSGLNPRIRKDENGLELHLEAVNGLFSTCRSCGSEVCNLNGLVAKVHRDSQSEGNVYLVKWQGRHTCNGSEYHEFSLPTGSRIA